MYQFFDKSVILMPLLMAAISLHERQTKPGHGFLFRSEKGIILRGI